MNSIEAFWAWFSKNESRLFGSLSTGETDLFDEIDRYINPISISLGWEFGPSENEGEIDLPPIPVPI